MSVKSVDACRHSIRLCPICTPEGFAEQLTLRDQFAMAALTGLCASANMTPTESKELAECAYDHADAMMEARKPK